MSNMLHLNGLTYFQLPQSLVKNDLLRKLNGNAVKLYVFLQFESQRTSRVDIPLNAETVNEQAGVSESGLKTAKKELEKVGLIKLKRGSNGHVYTLCDPDTKEPLAARGNADGIFFDFNSLKPNELEQYYRFHLKHNDLRSTENGLSACCPFHDDHRPSLTITLGQGSAWKCHGCEKAGKLLAFEQAIADRDGSPIDIHQAHRRVVRIFDSVGVKLTKQAQPEATYDYTDEYGEVLYQVRRYPGKSFPVYRPDAQQPGGYVKGIKGVCKVLYRLPELPMAKTVIFVEGEKDVESIRSLRLLDAMELPVAATTNIGGAGKWEAEYADSLANKTVIVIPDNDEKGIQHARQVEDSLKLFAKEVRLVQLPSDCKDASEYLSGHSPQQLVELIGEDLFSESITATI
jgi:5S rRNA maturation endonuclease (ribonuclease M5)